MITISPELGTALVIAVTNAVPSSGEIIITDKNFEVLGTIQTD